MAKRPTLNFRSGWGRPMVRVGVTGATGYIGGRLLPALAAQGYELRAVDDRSGPVRVEPKDRSVENADFASEGALRLLSDCDVILHLAAVSGVMVCARDPGATARVNIEGTRRLYELCRERRIPVVFASSFAVVGVPRELPVREEAPAQPTHEYARQKAEGESMTRDLSRRAAIPCVVLRQSNVYGGYLADGRLVTKANVLELFARQVEGGVLRVNAPGTQRRDFIHLEDVVAHWLAAATYVRRASAGSDAPTFNVASGEALSVLELADRVASAHARSHSGAGTLRVEVVENPRAGIELIEPGFAVDRSRTESVLGVSIHHRLETEIPTILRAGASPDRPITSAASLP